MNRDQRYNASKKGKRRTKRAESSEYRKGYRAGYKAGRRRDAPCERCAMDLAAGIEANRFHPGCVIWEPVGRKTVIA